VRGSGVGGAVSGAAAVSGAGGGGAGGGGGASGGESTGDRASPVRPSTVIRQVTLARARSQNRLKQLSLQRKFYEFYTAPITKFWAHAVSYFVKQLSSLVEFSVLLEILALKTS
jgi:hypothetical protein